MEIIPEEETENGGTPPSTWSENLRNYYQNGLNSKENTVTSPTPLFGHKGQSMICRPYPFFVSANIRSNTISGSAGHGACRGPKVKLDQEQPPISKEASDQKKPQILGWSLYPAEASQET